MRCLWGERLVRSQRSHRSRKSRAGGPTALQLGIGSSAADTAAGATPVAATVIGRTPGIGAGCAEGVLPYHAWKLANTKARELGWIV